MRGAFFLLPLVQGANLVSLATRDVYFAPPFEVDVVDPLTGNFTNFAADLGATHGNPSCSAFRNDNTLIYGTQFVEFDLYGCLVTVDLATGNVQEGDRYPLFFYSNVEFDKRTNQTFVTAYNISTTLNYVFEVLPNLALHKMSEFSGVITFDISTYSSSKHIFFFLMASGKDFVSNVVAAGTSQGGKILYSVPVPLTISTLMYDDTFGVLYAWGSDSTRTAVLVSVDYTTGKILKTFLESTALLTGGPACINKDGTAVYSSLNDQPSNHLVIHTLNLSSGNASQVPASRVARTLSFK